MSDMNDELPVYLMSPPREDWTLRGKANFKSQSAQPVDAARARREWSALADAICEAGGEVVVCPPNPRRNLTGMIYTAEAGEYYRDEDREGFVLPNMASEHRRLEADWIGGFVSGLGIRTESISATWEAQGDAIRANEGRKIVHTFGSGKYKRTESMAYEEVAHLLGSDHIQIHFRADPWFHGNTFLAVFNGPPRPKRLGERERRAPETVLVCAEALVPGELERLRQFLPHADFVHISRDESEGYDTNSLQVRDRVIGSSEVSSKARGVFDELGLEFVELDLGELFSKGGGAPVCLTNRLWNLDVNRLPDHVLWSMNPNISAHTSV